MVTSAMIVMLATGLSHDEIGCGLLAQDQQVTSSPQARNRTTSQPMPWGQRVAVDYFSTPLQEVAQDLSDHIGWPIHVKWNRLEEAGISQDHRVTLQVRDVTVETLLHFLCEATGLDYYVRDRYLVLTTPEDAERQSQTRIYPVADLLDYGVHVRLRVLTSKHRGGPHPGGGPGLEAGGFLPPATPGGEPFAAGAIGLAASPEPPTVHREDVREQLLDALQSHVSPDTWEINGGGSSCSMFGDLLIVTAPDRTHRLVRAFLNDLRRNIAAEEGP